MKILFCCEFYSPSVGGVQEVMKQIAERLVARGHQVTVATTTLPNRNFTSLNGVEIVEFQISGNLVRGMQGGVDRYREFVKSFPCDAILIKAAQQWTFDALWPILGEITARKVFIPCGFSGLYEDQYRIYFKYLSRILGQFDSLIFYSNDYRDINYAREHGLTNCIVLSNGASEEEFDILPDPTFRARHNIPEDSFLILTVGALSGAKGHLELCKAIQLLQNNGRRVSVLLNGNDPFPKRVESQLPPKKMRIRYQVLSCLLKNIHHPIKAIKDIRKIILSPAVVQAECITPYDQVLICANQINTELDNKKVLLLDLERNDLIQAYLAADLFVFASHVEYSPLVLFEAAASSTPFLSSNVGNAKEITSWLGGGFIFEDYKDDQGYSRINPQLLAYEISALMSQEPYLKEVGEKMHEAWKKKYTWDIIASQYEKILLGDN